MRKKILVIDDQQVNREAAKEQLSGICELTVVSTFKGAVEYMNRVQFDAILTDVMLPGEAEGVGRGIGDDTPYGLTIALISLSQGIPVRLVTDLDHHSSPIAWSLDQLRGLRGPINCIESRTPKNWRKAFDDLGFEVGESIETETENEYEDILVFMGDKRFFKNNLENFDKIKCVFVDVKNNYIDEILSLKPKYIWMTGELAARAGVCHLSDFRKVKSIIDVDRQKLIFS